MSKPKRDIDSFVKAHEMDSERTTLLVEGKEDRLFLEYLADDELKEDAEICEINAIEFPNTLEIEGGEKGRILHLSNKIKDLNLEVYFFIDTDYDNILEKPVPDNVIRTDYRDLESYLYEKEYFRKFLKVGLVTDKIDENYLWNEITEIKKLGYLRLCSELNKHKLPFQAVGNNFSRYYKVKPDLSTELLLDRYLEVLVQKCENQISIDELKNELNSIAEKYEHLSEKEIVHGKDTINVFKEIAKRIGKSKDNIDGVFWMSFNKDKIVEHENLKRVLEIIK